MNTRNLSRFSPSSEKSEVTIPVLPKLGIDHDSFTPPSSSPHLTSPLSPPSLPHTLLHSFPASQTPPCPSLINIWLLFNFLSHFFANPSLSTHSLTHSLTFSLFLVFLIFTCLTLAFFLFLFLSSFPHYVVTQVVQTLSLVLLIYLEYLHSHPSHSLY